METQLVEKGYEVATAGNGEEALVVLSDDPGIQLIVSDVHMPVMDGITMIETIAAKMGDRGLKIVMLTTEHPTIV